MHLSVQKICYTLAHFPTLELGVQLNVGALKLSRCLLFFGYTETKKFGEALGLISANMLLMCQLGLYDVQKKIILQLF